MPVVDTELTLYQIIALQNFHYAFGAIVISLLHFSTGSTASLDTLFLRKVGWEGVTATLISGIIGAGLLCLIIAKANRCLDFTATVFIIHLFVCSFYGGIPMSWQWWVSNLIAAITMVVGGEYLCSVYELRELPLFRYSSAVQTLNNSFGATPIGSPNGSTELSRIV